MKNRLTVTPLIVLLETMKIAVQAVPAVLVGGLPGQGGLAGIAGQAGLAGIAGQGGLEREAGLAGLVGIAGLAGLRGADMVNLAGLYSHFVQTPCYK